MTVVPSLIQFTPLFTSCFSFSTTMVVVRTWLIFLFSYHHLLLHCSSTSVSLVGINYGRVGNNLPSPSSVPQILSSIDVGRVRIYDADPTVLHAFANTGIELVIGLPDRCITKMAADPNEALNWVRSNVQAYVPATKIAAITVGNEVLTGNDTNVARCLVSAMDSLHSALVTLGLDRYIVVTTANSLAVLDKPSYPPSAAVFRRDLLPLLCQLFAFHARTGSPFFINAYPYFAYSDDPHGVDLNFALLDPSAAGFTDSSTALHYSNLLHAQVDAVYHAIAAATGGKAVVEVRVSETGWPSAGDPDEIGASTQNAAKYNGNLIRLVCQNKGTPLSPKNPLRVYIFALFNENQKGGPTSERNYGLFKPDGTPAYDLGIAFPRDNNNTTSSGHSGSSGSGGGQFPDGGGADGYYSISEATKWRTEKVLALSVVLLCFRFLLINWG